MTRQRPHRRRNKLGTTFRAGRGTGAEGFRREGPHKGTWGPLNKREMSLSPYQYGFGTVWAASQKEADKKAKKEVERLYGKPKIKYVRLEESETHGLFEGDILRYAGSYEDMIKWQNQLKRPDLILKKFKTKNEA